MHALCRYVTKDSVELNALLSIVVQARRDIDLYTSRAADAGTDERRARHLMQRICNKIDAELSDTFAAMIALGFPADDSSEIFVSWDPWEAVKEGKLMGPDPAASDLLAEEEVEEPEGTRSAPSSAPPAPAASCCAGPSVPADEHEPPNFHDDVDLGGAHNASELDDERRLGTAEVFRTNGKEFKPVPTITHYRYRGAQLLLLSNAEYKAMVAIVEKNKSPRKGKGGARFAFAPGHDLYETHEQQLREKIAVPMLHGPPPPRPPYNLGAGVNASPTWRRANERYLGWVGATHVPWFPPERFYINRQLDVKAWYAETKGDTAPVMPSEVEAWASVLQHMAEQTFSVEGESSWSTRDLEILGEGRLQALENLSHGLVVGEMAKKLHGLFRKRHRTTWKEPIPEGAHHRHGAENAEAAQTLDDLIAAQEARQLDPTRVRRCERQEAWLNGITACLKSSSVQSMEAPRSRNAADVGCLDTDAETVKALVKKLSKQQEEETVQLDVSAPPQPPTDAAFAAAALEALDRVPSEFERLGATKEEEEAEFVRRYAEWKSCHDEWLQHSAAAKARGEVFDTPAPVKVLNPDQRQFCREVWPVGCKMRAGRRANLPRAQYAEPLLGSLLWLLHGAGGNGKTTMLEVLQQVFLREGIGTIVFTAYTGVATTALPKPAATFCTLLSVSGQDGAANHPRAYDHAKHGMRFESIAGNTDELVAMVVDEVSQIGTNNIQHLNARTQNILGNSLLFGGLMVIAPGDVSLDARPAQTPTRLSF